MPCGMVSLRTLRLLSSTYLYNKARGKLTYEQPNAPVRPIESDPFRDDRSRPVRYFKALSMHQVQWPVLHPFYIDQYRMSL